MSFFKFLKPEIFLIFGLLFLFFAAFPWIVKNVVLAEKFANLAFLCLVVFVMWRIIDYFKNLK